MAAYILVFAWEIDETRRTEKMKPYFDQVGATMSPYGGRYLRLRLDPFELLEGDWQPPLGFAIIEFPSMPQARDWYQSPDYAPLRALRMAGSRHSLVLADGMPEGETLRSVMQELGRQEVEGE